MVVGFVWGEIQVLSDPYNRGARGLYRLTGVVQGAIGGLYCAAVISIQGAKRRWLSRDWILNGIVGAVPLCLVLVLLAASMGKAEVGWEASLIPIQSLLASFLTSLLINEELAADEAP